MASPEQTWALFLDSLRAGKIDTAVACFTPARGDEIRGWLAHLSREQLRALADSHTSFGMSNRRLGEAVIGRRTPQGDRLGFAYFTNDGGEWRVDEGP